MFDQAPRRFSGLFHRALRLSAAAAFIWLKNRRKDQWRDKQEHVHTGPGGGPLQMISTEMSAKEAADAYAATINGND